MKNKDNRISIVGQVEKGLEADIVVNRKGIITKARLHSSIYQGDKGILLGQPATTSLKITSRIFGFCGGSHQLAAARALESAWKLKVSPKAKLLRSIGQAAELLQNAPRWFYTTFAPDLTNAKFSVHALHEDATWRFSAFKGSSFKKGVIASSYPISLYSLIAGQWPQADFAIPGGVNSRLSLTTLTKAFALLDKFRSEWLEPIWLGGSIDRYFEIKTWQDLMVWLEEKDTHQNSDLGLFIRASLAYGLDQIGKGGDKLLAYGTFWNPDFDHVMCPEHHFDAVQLPGGYFDGRRYQSLSVKELMTQLHENLGGTISYQKSAIETGPLARALMAANPTMTTRLGYDPLFRDIYKVKGANVFTRVLARMHEATRFFRLTQHWLSELKLKQEELITIEVPKSTVSGFGMTEAPRGALSHYVELENNRIKNYQILAPTLINISSGQANGHTSPLAKALEGVQISDFENPIEVGLIARSFDAGLTCKVNLLKNPSEKKIGVVQL